MRGRRSHYSKGSMQVRWLCSSVASQSDGLSLVSHADGNGRWHPCSSSPHACIGMMIVHHQCALEACCVARFCYDRAAYDQ